MFGVQTAAVKRLVDEPGGTVAEHRANPARMITGYGKKAPTADIIPEAVGRIRRENRIESSHRRSGIKNAYSAPTPSVAGIVCNVLIRLDGIGAG